MKKLISFIFIGTLLVSLFSCNGFYALEADCMDEVSGQVYYLNDTFIENGEIVTDGLVDFYKAIIRNTNIIQFDAFLEKNTNSLSRLGNQELYCPPHNPVTRSGTASLSGRGSGGELYVIDIEYMYLHCKKCGADYDYRVSKTTVRRVG